MFFGNFLNDSSSSEQLDPKLVALDGEMLNERSVSNYIRLVDFPHAFQFQNLMDFMFLSVCLPFLNVIPRD